jgi:hypothetical protein
VRPAAPSHCRRPVRACTAVRARTAPQPRRRGRDGAARECRLSPWQRADRLPYSERPVPPPPHACPASEADYPNDGYDCRSPARRSASPSAACRSPQGPVAAEALPGRGCPSRGHASCPLSFSLPSHATAHGRLPEWPKGAVCKTVGSAYASSNLAPATPAKIAPELRVRSQGLLPSQGSRRQPDATEGRCRPLVVGYLWDEASRVSPGRGPGFGRLWDGLTVTRALPVRPTRRPLAAHGIGD